jgi:hypothetical protein
LLLFHASRTPNYAHGVVRVSHATNLNTAQF